MVKLFAATITKAEPKAWKVDQRDVKPKRKKTPGPYLIFCSERRPEVKVSYPTATFAEISKILARMWADLDDKSKKPYIREAAARRAAVSD